MIDGRFIMEKTGPLSIAVIVTTPPRREWSEKYKVNHHAGTMATGSGR